MKKKSIVLGIGFTNVCNMNCGFCYSKDNRMYSYSQPVDVWKNFLRKNGEYIQSINYGTGENALEDDWFEIIDFVAGSFPHIKQAVTTNGSLSHILNQDRKKEQVFLRAIQEVDVSLDYNNKELHNSIRNNQFAYDFALETMKYCNTHERRLSVVTIGLDETLEIGNISGIFEIAKKYDALNRINIYRKTAGKMDDCELNYDVLMSFLEWVSKNYKIVELSDPLFNAIAGGNEDIIDASGRTSFRIVSDGRIFPSTYLLTDKFLMGNICDEDFSFDNVNVERFTNSMVIPSECSGCSLCDKCRGGAIDRRYLWYGTFEERDPYCPKRHPKSRKYIFSLPEIKEKFESVHNGYLPTLFFKS